MFEMWYNGNFRSLTCVSDRLKKKKSVSALSLFALAKIARYSSPHMKNFIPNKKFRSVWVIAINRNPFKG